MATTPHPTLLAAAAQAQSFAYAPYSGYHVGAAIEGEDGRVWTGANVENVSYGATICAERSAIAKMVSEGGRAIRRVAVVTRDGGTPCGICLQCLLEFAPDPREVEVVVQSSAGVTRVFSLAELMPHGFQSSNVHRTE